MKFKELKAMPAAELKDKFAQLNQELIKERAQIATGTMPKSPGKIRVARKTIAKIKMIFAEAKKKA